MSRLSARSPRRRSGRSTRRNIPRSGTRLSRPRCEVLPAGAPHPDSRPALAGRGTSPRQRESLPRTRSGGEGQRLATTRAAVLLIPKIVVTALLILAVGDMLAGVFLRYVMVAITDF